MTDERTTTPDGMPDTAAQGPENTPGQPITDTTATTQGDGTSTEPETTVAADAASDVDALAEQLTAELEEQKDKYVRLFAEFENFRKRAVRDRQEAEQRGMSNMLRGLLEALDDVARFAHVDPKSTDAATVVEGVAMVERKLLKSLGGHGLEVVNPAGEPFDPALHEALSTAPAASPEQDHLVAQVYQVGYVFNGMLLRPARVVVHQWNA